MIMAIYDFLMECSQQIEQQSNKNEAILTELLDKIEIIFILESSISIQS